MAPNESFVSNYLLNPPKIHLEDRPKDKYSVTNIFCKNAETPEIANEDIVKVNAIDELNEVSRELNEAFSTMLTIRPFYHSKTRIALVESQKNIRKIRSLLAKSGGLSTHEIIAQRKKLRIFLNEFVDHGFPVGEIERDLDRLKNQMNMREKADRRAEFAKRKYPLAYLDYSELSGLRAIILLDNYLEDLLSPLQGSWMETCELQNWDGEVLQALCKDQSGSMITSEISIASDVGEIINDDGQLRSTDTEKELDARNKRRNIFISFLKRFFADF